MMSDEDMLAIPDYKDQKIETENTKTNYMPF